MRDASFVVMLQADVSCDDVQFYTEMGHVECENRQHVSALSFRKPVRIHPILFTTNVCTAVIKMLECYANSIDDNECMHPFMVFCSSVKFAEFLVSELQKKQEI